MEKAQKREIIVYHYEDGAPSMDFKIDRSVKTPLAEQIQLRIKAAIECGALEPGSRLPSWQDLATQLGVSRGTVRTAYEIRPKPVLHALGR